MPRAGCNPQSWYGQSCHPNPIAEVSEIIPSDDLLLKISIRRKIPCWDRDQPLSIHRAEVLSPSCRHSLGYHSKALGGTEVVYGRDNMAAPLRVMRSVILEIADEEFKPDATKSGMLKRKATSQKVGAFDSSGDFKANKAGFQDGSLADALEDETHERGNEAAVEELLSSSEESNDESEPEHDALESAIETVIGRWSPMVSLDSDSSVVFARHSLSRMLHVAADETLDRFMCGRELSPLYVKLDSKPKVFHPMCTQCLKTLQKHAKTVKRTSKRREKNCGGAPNSA